MLEVDDLSVSYGRVRAVKAASLSVRAGEVVSVLGANGAGKSSLAKAVFNLTDRDSGTVRFDGEPVTKRATHHLPRAGLVLVPEMRRLFANLSVRDNLLLGSSNKRDGAGQLNEVLDRFPRLRSRIAQTAGTLSGGEQQMVAIARAIMAKPKLLVLDEPSLGLAPIMVKEVFALLAQLKLDGLTMVILEQNASQGLSVADRGYVLELGEVVLEGNAAELQNDSRVRAAYLGV